MAPATTARRGLEHLPSQRVSLVDLLDRVLAGGVVVTGEITLSISDVDLVTISLRALLSSVSALLPPENDRQAPGERPVAS